MRYEGLSLSELLDLLHEIVLPEAVSWVPQTPGWWIAAAWFVAVVAVGIAQWIMHRRRNRYRRDAQQELLRIAARAETEPAATAAEIAILLKRTALCAYPRERVASLSGREWAAFLSASANDDPIVGDAANRIAAAAYRPGIDGQTLVAPARRWIRVHRA